MGRRAGTPRAGALGVVALVGIAASAVVSGAEAQGTWSEAAPLSEERVRLAAGVVDGKLYAVGGEHRTARTSWQARSTVEVYDPATDTWAPVTPLPSPRASLAAGVVDGKLYAVGGLYAGQVLSKVEVYDPATDTWSEVAPMNGPRRSFAAGVVDGKLYAVGGYDGGGGTDFVGTVEAYDPATDTWTQKASLPTLRAYLTAGVVGGKLYAVGGEKSPDRLDAVEAYDPATDTWAAVAPMPTARSKLVAGVVFGKLYALGGESGGVFNSVRIDAVEAYDPATDTWAAAAPMPTNGSELAAEVVGDMLYALGGFKGQGVQALPVVTVEAYNPLPPPPPPPSPSLLPSPPPSSAPKTEVVIGAAAGGVALLASLAAAIVVKRRRALYRQQAARLTMARASASV